MIEDIVAAKAKILTPKGRALWATLNTPDVKFDPAGKYSVKIAFGDDEAVSALIEKLTDMRDKYVAAVRAELQKGNGSAKAKAKSLKVRPVVQPVLDEDGEETDEVFLNASMKASGVSKKTSKPWTRSPALFDAAGRKLDEAPAVYGGSILRVAAEAQPYYKAADNEIGVSLRLEAVQIIELVSGGQRDASDYGFGSEDGFTAEDSAAGSPFGGEGGGTAEDDADGAGF